MGALPGEFAPPRLRAILTLVGACAVLATAPRCPADLLMLNSGGIVRGRVSDAASSTAGKRAAADDRRRAESAIVVTTLTGARLVIPASDVRNIKRRSLVVEEFEVRNRQAPEQVPALWTLAEWCKTKGLRTQREDVLRRILALDPDYVPAHQGLGQIKRDGQWTTPDEEMRSRGFVKFEGRYVTEQEIEILKKLRSRRKVEQDWVDRVRSCLRALAGTDAEKRRRGWEQLAKINDPAAIPALNKFLRASENPDVREIYVKVIARIAGAESVRLLVEQSLFDESQSVRVTAQEAITGDRRASAAPHYARELGNPNNDVVRRAAMMLGRIGDENCVPALIEALVTTHAVPTQVVDNSNSYSFGRGGSLANPNTIPLPPDVYGKLVTGQYPNGVNVIPPPGFESRVKTVMVDRQFHNAEALAALESLTRQSFGYDKDQWRRWWAAKTTTGIVRSSKAP